jgi:hypothetical protein
MQHTTIHKCALEKCSVRAFEAKQIDGDFHTEGFGGETNGPARRYCIRATLPPNYRARERERLKIRRGGGKSAMCVGAEKDGCVFSRADHHASAHLPVIKKEIDLHQWLIVGRTPAPPEQWMRRNWHSASRAGNCS